jgi:hypothetical protein
LAINGDEFRPTRPIFVVANPNRKEIEQIRVTIFRKGLVAEIGEKSARTKRKVP